MMSTTSFVILLGDLVNSQLFWLIIRLLIIICIGIDRQEAKEQLNSLLQTLAGVGFLTEVRPGDRSSLLIFIRAPHKSLLRATHTTRYDLESHLLSN
jgi:hypothetical protein